MGAEVGVSFLVFKGVQQISSENNDILHRSNTQYVHEIVR